MSPLRSKAALAVFFLVAAVFQTGGLGTKRQKVAPRPGAPGGHPVHSSCPPFLAAIPARFAYQCPALVPWSAAGERAGVRGVLAASSTVSGGAAAAAHGRRLKAVAAAPSCATTLAQVNTNLRAARTQLATAQAAQRMATTQLKQCNAKLATATAAKPVAVKSAVVAATEVRGDRGRQV